MPALSRTPRSTSKLLSRRRAAPPLLPTKERQRFYDLVTTIVMALERRDDSRLNEIAPSAEAVYADAAAFTADAVAVRHAIMLGLPARQVDMFLRPDVSPEKLRVQNKLNEYLIEIRELAWPNSIAAPAPIVHEDDGVPGGGGVPEVSASSIASGTGCYPICCGIAIFVCSGAWLA